MSSSHVSRRLSTLGGLASLATLIGCAPDTDPALSRGSTVVVAYCCGVEALNPNRWMPSQFLVFLPLATRLQNGTREGRLAKRWEYSPGYDEVTFHLRTDVRWHDGVPVTAHDIAFTWELLTHPDILHYRFAGEGTITVVDDSTYVMGAEEWEEEEVDAWTVYYPKHVLEGLDPKEFYQWDFWTSPVGNGPYRFVRYVPGTLMEFEANPDYYRGKRPIDRVVLKFTAGAAVTELLSGSVDAVTDADPADVAMVIDDPRFRAYHRPLPSLHAIFWQQTRPFFQDASVRRALTLAIDRPVLREVMSLPSAIPLFDEVATPHLDPGGERTQVLPHDPVEAGALLQAAGWTDSDGDGIREREGRRFEFTALAPGGFGWQRMAVYVQDQLRQVGVKMNISAIESGVMWERWLDADFDAAFMFSSASNYGHYGETTPYGYSNLHLAELFERKRVTAHPEARKAILLEIAEILQTDQPATILLPRVETSIVHRRIRGLGGVRADPVWYMEDLWIEEEG